ncbi:hypothetical protein [Pseudoduganella aquatica]|uniref:Uncharacterized protein n=1 Tax=Pseudoduganella aquatica TaxID=2660641 RepID=A0A7X4H8E8_9BURK|nr:hypothetical protein [Pseudoduganella aquatica]MYN06571.1 hypothetical protein [Pseudoduganella aquatica]
MSDDVTSSSDNPISVYDLFLKRKEKAIRKIRWRLRCHFPNSEFLISRGDREYRIQSDMEDNQKIRLPDEEKLDVMAVWGAELFGPSEIESLYANFSRLGWDVPRIGSDRDGVVHWIREQRMYGSVGNYNVGIVSRKGENRFLGVRYFAPMPEDVENLSVGVYQLSPSLTCVLVGFFLTEHAGARYKRELDLDRKTIHRTEWARGAIASYGVEHLKIEAIENTRMLQRSMVTTWFEQQLPGFFSNAKDGNRLPTAEILLTEVETCFPANRADSHQREKKWRRLIARISPMNVWTSEECQGLQLVMDELSGDARYHLIMALRGIDVPDEKLEYRGGRNRRSLATYCEDYLSGALVYYASIAFLREGERTVKLTRERLREAGNDEGIVRTLENIKYYFTESIGLPTIASELKNGAKKTGWYRHWCENFTMESWRDGDDKYSLPEVLRSRTKVLASRFIKEEAASREQFEQISSILNTQESVKTQKRMERLTWGALILAFSSLIAALPVDDLSKKLKSVVEQVVK